MKNAIYVLLLFSFIQCKKEMTSKSPPPLSDTMMISEDSANVVLEPVVITSKKNPFKTLNNEVMETLKDKNYEKFATFIHPEKGISFSMGVHLNPEKDQHFNRETYLKYLNTETKFTWGEKDGTGDLLVLPIKNYFDEWVFKRDFTNSEFYLNQFKGKGNTLNNIKKWYPDAMITENYIPGSEIYSGMDWDSLLFVFEEFNGKYYLVAVANNYWTT